jgi:hypothetical protein
VRLRACAVELVHAVEDGLGFRRTARVTVVAVVMRRRMSAVVARI